MTHASDPMAAFEPSFARAASTAPPLTDHTAAALATTDGSGRPSVRMVLVRLFDAGGFLFFTNYESRKARELDANPRAALCFNWAWLEEQVRVEGHVTRATGGESDAYFTTRPRGSQIGAWASRQSHVLTARALLEDRYRELEAEFGDRVVPRPPFWGGYRLVPDRVEFWKAGTYRLHERLIYIRDGDGWRTEVLYP
jgi:pyridoxamine 5'-phosphate oxidase